MSGHRKKVKVLVRIRPTANFAHGLISLQKDSKTIDIHCKRDAKKGVVNNQILDWSFKLDGVLHNAYQDLVFESCGSSVVSSALDGYNGTLMCYGQTGAGKTYTVTGATESYKHRGLIPRSIAQIFREMERRQDSAITVRVSYLEIYNETMFDLLSTLPENVSAGQTALTIVEDRFGVYVKGLSCHLAQTEEEALNLLFEGEMNRTIAEHSLNKASSRSHCIFTIYIENRSRVHSDAKYTISKLNFVDLAGSERLSKTKSEGKTLQEAMYINKSLSFLEQTVIALADRNRDHIPYRQTKLTHCLKDSIGGNCQTVLVANIWAEAAQIEETISTLRFATRMMCVNSEPAINENIDPVIMVKKLEQEVMALRHELAMHDTLNNRSLVTYDPLSDQQKYDSMQQVQRYLDGSLEEIDIVNIRQIKGMFESFKECYISVEKEVSERMKEKYANLLEKSQARASSGSQKTEEMNEDVQLVGETDKQSFGVGNASRSAKAEPSSVVNAKKREMKQRKSRERNSPSGTKGLTSPVSQKADGAQTPATPSAAGDKEHRADAATPVSPAAERIAPQPPRPSTPPNRTVAFEEFKQEVGSEINRILTENKDVLASKKYEYSQMARHINQTKLEIDKSRMVLESLKAEREANGTLLNDEGEIIISEEEFLGIQRLKDLKHEYLSNYSDFRNLHSEVIYCEKLVDQCRQKLIQEFDKWFSESYLDPVAVQTSSGIGYGHRGGTMPSSEMEDDGEIFEHLRAELMMSNPEAMAFYNAKQRTNNRRTYYEAMSQPQPRRPGVPLINIRNKPPTTLQVQ